jgi:hypothetical protein
VTATIAIVRSWQITSVTATDNLNCRQRGGCDHVRLDLQNGPHGEPGLGEVVRAGSPGVFEHLPDDVAERRPAGRETARRRWRWLISPVFLCQLA